MHGPENDQGPGPPPRGWIWLLAGTGEGPELAAGLLRRGWGVRVSVVSAAATRAYRPHPWLQVGAGALAGVEAIAAELRCSSLSGAEPPGRYAAVIDATHPFAVRISAALELACRDNGQPLLRLQREVSGGGAALPLQSLCELGRHSLANERLLLAIGARRLGEAVALSPGAVHHARLLPTAAALQKAIAAGIPAERLACVRPSRSGWIEAALLSHWGITTVLARQGGGFSEAVWQRLAAERNLNLLLLQRPRPVGPTWGEALPLADLLARLAAWPTSTPCLPEPPHG
jgi:precorrin-6A/cobalt-precorrin-6A reductase